MRFGLFIAGAALVLSGCVTTKPARVSSEDSYSYNPTKKMTAKEIREDLERSAEVNARSVKTVQVDDGNGHKTDQKVVDTSGIGTYIYAFPVTDAYIRTVSREEAEDKAVLEHWSEEQTAKESDRLINTIKSGPLSSQQCFHMTVKTSDSTRYLNQYDKRPKELDPKQWKLELVQNDKHTPMTMVVSDANVVSQIRTYAGTSTRTNEYVATWFGCATTAPDLHQEFKLVAQPGFYQYLEPIELVWQMPKKVALP